MSLHVALRHVTTYRYDRPIQLGPQIIRLRPAPHSRTPIISYSLRIEPGHHFLNWQQDPQSNYLARAVFPEKTRLFRIEVDLVADMQVVNPFDFFLDETAEAFPFVYDEWLAHELKPFLVCQPIGPKLAEWMAGIDRSSMATVPFLAGLNQRLQNDINYLIRMEPGVQTPEETLTSRSGSCRDSAWLMVQILRNLGLAARFVSGYLIQLTPDVKSLDGPSGTETDFTDLHAWCEVYLPGAGWFGLDPTSGLAAGEGHIPLAATPDPFSAAPISGMVEAATTEFDFEMSVSRILESPRVTKPYSDDQWTKILTVGNAVDARLKAGDVRLTMGGEPTFVSVDDMEGEEWNTAAVGPTKRGLADTLIRRLRARFAPGGMFHYGQGKWYPGESLPRWAFSLFWRRDGVPVWRDDSLIARETEDHKPTVDIAHQFISGIADRLEISTENILPAYEDPLTYIAREQSLPANVTLEDSKLDDPEERARLAKVLSQGLSKPSGYVLPVQGWNAHATGGRWRSEKWSLKRGKLYLAAGDSPAGLRLPLGNLPWVPKEDYPYTVETDPFEGRPPLPASPDPARQPFRSAHPQTQTQAGTTSNDSGRQTQNAQQVASNIGGVVRTALTIEPRNGRLCVFMPPVATLEEYLDLMAAVEDTATELKTPVHLEGYPPPRDPRLALIQVTPDPGVIEVNVHPTSSWDDLVDLTENLYEDARQTRLATEKFMVDGRHTGTGGGNHLVLGGADPDNSPFLRRPDLLKSLICYWQNHPALSYLFSGLFIGPTSQAPRMDEARHDVLYEMEIAFKQVPDPAGLNEPGVPPWLVDRIFRNLLTDVTGNTHRSEICIDKMYSPDSPTGRLGLVEFRAFEMPPHARMSLVQQLLLRALIARFWEKPYERPLVRWGTQLHDRFMLPHYVWEDLKDVLADLADHDMHLEPAWFAPHFEFRFPVFGTVHYAGIDLEIRQALEPWNVLGETGATGGTVRYVDSSVERLQVRASGLTDRRHIVTCNGRAMPMAPTGTQGEAVAGVRFRAWQPPNCLHPTIGVHAPLVFDIVDTWSQRAIGGCTYHVAHPGGRAHETFPVNSYEAEGRRLSRFFKFGHTPGPCTPTIEPPNPDFPHTLDLRR